MKALGLSASLSLFKIINPKIVRRDTSERRQLNPQPWLQLLKPPFGFTEDLSLCVHLCLCFSFCLSLVSISVFSSTAPSLSCSPSFPFPPPTPCVCVCMYVLFPYLKCIIFLHQLIWLLRFSPAVTCCIWELSCLFKSLTGRGNKYDQSPSMVRRC